MEQRYRHRKKNDSIKKSNVRPRKRNRRKNKTYGLQRFSSNTILENNKNAKKPILVEISLFFESDSVLIIERDSGELLDLTDPDLSIKGLSGFTLSGLMEAQKEKSYLVTTGYNRNMIRFSRNEA